MPAGFSSPSARTWTAPPGGGRVLVKDESSRLGLPAFKILGASWACHQVMLRQPGTELVTARGGDHGRAVARMPKHFRVAATVFVPDVMLPETAAIFEAEGAVRAATAYAGETDRRALVQDTAWEGYTDVPGWIVDGCRGPDERPPPSRQQRAAVEAGHHRRGCRHRDRLVRDQARRHAGGGVQARLRRRYVFSDGTLTAGLAQHREVAMGRLASA